MEPLGFILLRGLFRAVFMGTDSLLHSSHRISSDRSNRYADPFFKPFGMQHAAEVFFASSYAVFFVSV